MSEYQEQKICLKLCASNKISFTESLKMLKKAYGDNCVSKTQAFDWYASFKEGREETEDLPCSDITPTITINVNVEKAKKLVLKNARISEREIAIELNITADSTHSILVDNLSLQRVAEQFVPKKLNILQQEHRKMIALDMISESSCDPTFITRIITGDEMWFYEQDVETNQKSSEPSKLKIMVTVFFDCHGIVHSEFLPADQTLNDEYHLNVMKRLLEAISKKRPDLWKDNSWILYHNDAPSMSVREFLAKNSVTIIPQAPYSPDLSPCDFFLFPKLKILFCGKRFKATDHAIGVLKKNSLEVIPSSNYEQCFEEWEKRWHMCIANDGDYFEVEEINFSD